MKNYFFTITALLCFICCSIVKAQDSVTDTIKNKALGEAARKKTLTTQELLGNLYQIAANDLTADSKSIKFSSTIFGLEKVFNPSVNDSRVYKQQWLERYLGFYGTYNYKNNFNTSNFSIGAN